MEGATENAATVQALLDNLVSRGLDPTVPRLFIADGAKALSKAIQHQVHRPATEPILLRRRFPARDRDLAAVHAPGPRALDLDLAAVEADPSPRSAPTVRPPRRVATVARPAGRRDIRLHHRAERLESLPQGRTDRSSPALLQKLRPQPRSPANQPV